LSGPEYLKLPNWIKLKHCAVDVKSRRNDNQCIKWGSCVAATFNTIMKTDDVLSTVEVSKLTLEPTDFKRHILSCSVKTLAHGHWRIRELALPPENPANDPSDQNGSSDD
jgi:hypothetical protein